MRAKVYVAFLRGINVGGNAVVRMADLKKTFESLGFTNVMPVLASGNLVFEISNSNPALLRKKIESKLTKDFGLQVVAILRSGSQILDLLKADPFSAISVTPNTRLHVTFMAEQAQEPPKFDMRQLNQGFQIVRASNNEVCCAIEASATAGTPELMKLLEKELGKHITTRTWNTIQKIGKIIDTTKPTPKIKPQGSR